MYLHYFIPFSFLGGCFGGSGITDGIGGGSGFISVPLESTWGSGFGGGGGGGFTGTGGGSGGTTMGGFGGTGGRNGIFCG